MPSLVLHISVSISMFLSFDYQHCANRLRVLQGLERILAVLLLFGVCHVPAHGVRYDASIVKLEHRVSPLVLVPHILCRFCDVACVVTWKGSGRERVARA